MSFSDFKKRSKNNISDLSSKLEAEDSKKSYNDDRFWKPELDKSSNGYAVIRFLPPSDESGEETPWAKYYSHGFKGLGGWYIENCPTTLGAKCPACESNNKLWNSGIESDKNIARSRKRKLNYVSNIFVVSDPANPQNEGKVFLYRYGQKIFGKIKESTHPEFEDETPINPFDFWAGANFKLKVRKVAGYINYDKSEFESSAPLFGDDDKMEEIWKKQYSLKEFTDQDNYKEYSELGSHLNRVLGENVRSSGSDIKSDTIEDTKITETSSQVTEESTSEVSDTEAGDALSYFEKLASES